MARDVWPWSSSIDDFVVVVVVSFFDAGAGLFDARKLPHRNKINRIESSKPNEKQY